MAAVDEKSINEILPYISDENMEKILSLLKRCINEQFVSKSNSNDIFGKNNLGSNGQYNPGLVPAGHPNSTANMYLGGDGTWRFPVIRGGTLTRSSPGSQTVNCGINKIKYIEIYDATGALGISASVDNNIVTQICNRIGTVSSTASLQFTAYIGNTSAGSTFYWRVYGEL